ncbi:DGQHR domain-containing protein [Curtobacterium flaccumfaciens]|uniref:DGQHR domain-containing protein n=1 Tax=Curtobacterium flaccumfaciens TaxID=2035 RepID=UPI00188ACB60|nr:DGQHR domain-containing protein [Curtobacterium flaccumfaciens]MBF4593745.1 DGQHR domain-containing protein [Curtobacterium flaccumfaciens]
MSLDQLLTAKISSRQVNERLASVEKQNVAKSLRADYEAAGWEAGAESVRKVQFTRTKKHDVAFEDRVWAAFASLGFDHLNKDRKLTISYGTGAGDKKQIDVLAVDDEVILVVECKSSAAAQPPAHSFKTEVEAISGYRIGLIQSIKKDFPNHKIRFVFATNNFNVSPSTKERFVNAQIVHLDEDAISYYIQLGQHLGKAGKYQLLGTLFAGTKIPGMDTAVPAIQSKMGGHTYYSFNIEPERLLKLSYVLHRNAANSQLMPTYQRLIKRTRLKKVAKFVDEGGFFPNSLIINFDVKKLNFSPAAGQVGESRIGVLDLPQLYRCAYVIDGQHRLYGFADSTRAASELVPVVAFVGLPPTDQVRLFMQINENQQAVPKNLQNTLNSDLLWDSKDLSEKSKALRLRIAQALEDAKSSPLRGRIILGENRKDARRCITIEAIANGLARGNLLGKFLKSSVKTPGLMYLVDNPTTMDHVAPLLEMVFQLLRDELPEQWEAGDAGYVFINNGVEGVLRLVSDLVAMKKKAGEIDPQANSPLEIFVSIRGDLLTAIDYLRQADSTVASDLKRTYGSSGGVRYLRRLQTAVASANQAFKPDGLEEYLKSEAKEFNGSAFSMVNDIERLLHDKVRARLEQEFGETWIKECVPLQVYRDANERATDRSWEADGEEVDWWDCLYLSDYQKIMRKSQAVWDVGFGEGFTPPELRGKKGSWKDRSSWMSVIIDARNAVAHARSISEEEFAAVADVHDWLSSEQG